MADPVRTERRRVLVVDDDFDILEALGNALEGRYDVVLAHDAREALDVLDREPINAVVLDLMMPGMDTAEFMRERDARHPRVPIIAASARHDIARACADVGIARWIQKPFRLADLYTQLRAVVAPQDPEGNGGVRDDRGG